MMRALLARYGGKSMNYTASLLIAAGLLLPKGAEAQRSRIGVRVQVLQASGYVVGLHQIVTGDTSGSPQTHLALRLRAPDGSVNTELLEQVEGTCSIQNQRIRTEFASAQCVCAGKRVEFTVRRQSDSFVVLRRVLEQESGQARGGGVDLMDGLVVEGELNPRAVLNLMSTYPSSPARTEHFKSERGGRFKSDARSFQTLRAP